ncbi:hypothetical protein FRC02_005036 [Tulasnella sp. 418]|nr:hypothetical protein FRC02_005036 [Tulasnella sp. 418]
MLEMAKEFDIDEEGLQSLTGALMFGGATTPASFIQFIIYLAAAHPEFQRKVQEELDRVVGSERAPTVEDLPNLPYLSIFLKEVYRFRPLNSLLAPHFSTEDQIYKGKLIPKDSTVVLNIWGICHDPELFEDPETFNPDRFIGSQFGMKPEVDKETDSEVLKRWEGLMFGAGRRRCPASQISYDLLGHISASIFWAFELSPPLDEQGREKKLDPWAFECALTNNLHPFKLTIKPRSRRHMQVVKHNYAAATSTFEPFELELAEEDKVYVRNARQELEAREL